MTVTREPPAKGDDLGVTVYTCGAMLRKCALSVEYCTPSSVTCTINIAVAAWVGDVHVTVSAAYEKVALVVPMVVKPSSKRQPYAHPPSNPLPRSVRTRPPSRGPVGGTTSETRGRAYV